MGGFLIVLHESENAERILIGYPYIEVYALVEGALNCKVNPD